MFPFPPCSDGVACLLFAYIFASLAARTTRNLLPLSPPSYFSFLVHVIQFQKICELFSLFHFYLVDIILTRFVSSIDSPSDLIFFLQRRWMMMMVQQQVLAFWFENAILSFVLLHHFFSPLLPPFFPSLFAFSQKNLNGIHADTQFLPLSVK